MITSTNIHRTNYRLLRRIRLLVLTIITLAVTTFAQGSHEQVEGVRNFERVTDRYFRGGQVTEDGVDHLARIGARTIIDLRDKSSAGEPEAFQRNSIKYIKFPAYVYGDTEVLVDEDKKDEKSSMSKRKKDKKEEAKDQKQSNKADDETTSAVREDAGSEIARQPGSSPATGRLSADAGYMAIKDAIKRVKAEGASGDLLKIDLEWDDVRSAVTWDLTFSSGTEYELDAITGKLLGKKPKASSKLALLEPLELSGDTKKMFQEIIKKAEKSQSKPVMEMELKRIKGHSQTIFEVSLTSGATLYYDAATGEAIAAL